MLKSDRRRFVGSVLGARKSNETLRKWNQWKILKLHSIQRPGDSICQLETRGYIRKIIRSASTSIT